MAQSRVGSSGNRVLAELSQNPTARKNKYDELRRKFDALERHADFLETRLKATEKSGNQGAYNAILQQLQNAESRVNNIVTEMNSIAESSRYSAQQDRRQQRITDRKPKTTMDKVRESLPYQIGSGIRDMIVDTGKGIGQTALYAENELRTGKAGTQLNPNTMQMEDIQFGDVADTYIKEGAKTAGTYLDFLNSLAYRGFTGRGKPDSENERFRNMIGNAVPKMFVTTDIVDPTVAKGAEIVADPLALVPVAGRVKAGVDAVTDPKLWHGIARDMSAGTRSEMFKPVVPTVELKPSRVPVKINDIKPAKENIRDVIESNFISGKLVGDTTMPIDSLFGGVGNEVSDIRRVNDLANKISSPNGYVERLIVDDAGNVVEGQHRLDALRKLGIKDVPVTVIRDNTRQFPTFKVEQAVDSAQPMRSDHVNQIVSYLATAFADEGGDVTKLMQYQPPRGYETAWRAGIEAIKSHKAIDGYRNQKAKK